MTAEKREVLKKLSLLPLLPLVHEPDKADSWLPFRETHPTDPSLSCGLERPGGRRRVGGESCESCGGVTWTSGIHGAWPKYIRSSANKASWRSSTNFSSSLKRTCNQSVTVSKFLSPILLKNYPELPWHQIAAVNTNKIVWVLHLLVWQFATSLEQNTEPVPI